MAYVKWVLLLCLHFRLTAETVSGEAKDWAGEQQTHLNPEFPFHQGKSALELAEMQLFGNKTKDFLTLRLILCHQN